MDKNLFNDTTQGLLEAVSIKNGFFTAKKTDEIPEKIKVLTYLNDDEQRKTSQKYKDILNTFIGNSKEKESFVKRLQNIPESYFAFEIAVLTHVEKSDTKYEAVKNFMDENTNATTSEILKFITNQPDFGKAMANN